MLLLPSTMQHTTKIENRQRAMRQAKILAFADTLCVGTLAQSTGPWSGDEGREHRAYLNTTLDLAVTAAIYARDYSRARLLAAALNLGV